MGRGAVLIAFPQLTGENRHLSHVSAIRTEISQWAGPETVPNRVSPLVSLSLSLAHTRANCMPRRPQETQTRTHTHGDTYTLRYE